MGFLVVCLFGLIFGCEFNGPTPIPPYPRNPFVIKLEIPPIQSNEDSAGGIIVADLYKDGRMDYARFKERADRLYVADVAGDWREELIVLSGNELRIYQNEAKNPNPDRPRLWTKQHYRRAKSVWNYYSP